MTPPSGINPLQFRPLKCGHCLSGIFELIQCGPILRDKLDPANLQFTPGPGFKCAWCGRLFDPSKASEPVQEIEHG